MKLFPNQVYLARFRGKGNCPAWADYRICQALRNYPQVPSLHHLFRLRQLNNVDNMDQDYWTSLESGSDSFDILCEVPGYCCELTLELQTESVLRQIDTIQRLIFKPEKILT